MKNDLQQDGTASYVAVFVPGAVFVYMCECHQRCVKLLLVTVHPQGSTGLQHTNTSAVF